LVPMTLVRMVFSMTGLTRQNTTRSGRDQTKTVERLGPEPTWARCEVSPGARI
jgi:hypothetical protein